jgi:hypothetical protein
MMITIQYLDLIGRKRKEECHKSKMEKKNQRHTKTHACIHLFDLFLLFAVNCFSNLNLTAQWGGGGITRPLLYFSRNQSRTNNPVRNPVPRYTCPVLTIIRVRLGPKRSTRKKRAKGEGVDR